MAAAVARGRASVLLSEGRWFDSTGLHVEVSLGKIPNPTAPDVLVGTLHGSHHHVTHLFAKDCHCLLQTTPITAS